MAREKTPPETTREAIALAYATEQAQAKLREELTSPAPVVHPAVLEELRALMFRHRYQSVIRNAIQARISELERQARRAGQ